MNIEPYLVNLNSQFTRLDENENMMGQIIDILLAFKTKSETLNDKLKLLEERIRKCMDKGKIKSKDLAQELMRKFSKIEELNEQIERLQNEEIEPEDLVQFASQKIIDLQNEISELQEKVGEKEEQLKIKDQKFKDEGKKIEQFERDKDQLKNRMDIVNRQLRDIDNATETDRNRISQDIIHLVAEFLTLLNRLQEMGVEVYPQETARVELERLNDMIINLEQQKQVRLDELAQLQQQLVENQKNLTQIQRELEKAKRQKDTDKNELQQLMDQIAQKQSDSNQVREEIEFLQGNLQVSEDELDTLLEQKARLEELKKKASSEPVIKTDLEEQYIKMNELSQRLKNLGLDDQVQDRVNQIIDEALETRVKDVVDNIINAIKLKLNNHIEQMRSLMTRLKNDFSDPDTLSIYQMEKKVDELLDMLEDCEKTTQQLSQMSQISRQETIDVLQKALENCKLNYLELKLYKEKYPTDKIFENVQDYDYVLGENDFNNVRDQCEKIEMGLRWAKIKYQINPSTK